MSAPRSGRAAARNAGRLALLAVACLLATSPPAWTQESTQIQGFLVDQRGNLGVGTSAPTQQLQVAGNALVEGLLMGTGNDGKFGSSALINGFDLQYGQRPFFFAYNDTGDPQTSIQVHAINPNNPNQTVFKTFIIDHPLDRSRYLVHAAIEGPEGAVYYRGSGRLEGGRARIELPEYFEALTCRGGRTIQLTNVDGFDRLAVRTQEGETIRDGAFLVMAENPASSQRFDWEVKAVRADGPALVVEPGRHEIVVGGFGPYTFPRAQAVGAAPCPPHQAVGGGR